MKRSFTVGVDSGIAPRLDFDIELDMKLTGMRTSLPLWVEGDVLDYFVRFLTILLRKESERFLTTYVQPDSKEIVIPEKPYEDRDVDVTIVRHHLLELLKGRDRIVAYNVANFLIGQEET